MTRSTESVVRTETYRDLKCKDRVRVKYGTYKGCRVEFLCHAVSRKSGAEWLEIYGGRRGQEWVIALPLDAI